MIGRAHTGQAGFQNQDITTIEGKEEQVTIAKQCTWQAEWMSSLDRPAKGDWKWTKLQKDADKAQFCNVSNTKR